MTTLVMKFGGAALAAPERFGAIAELILSRFFEFDQIAVVVSAMGDTTDGLIALAKLVNPYPPTRELDMLISAGERISISLLAMALAKLGTEAVSFTGSQSGIITTRDHTEAKIVDVRPFRLLPFLEKRKVVIVAGFQGVSKEGQITTLGRGGSDTSAVALGVALEAEKVEFYKDVPGICSADPKVDPHARVYPYLSYEEAMEIVNRGAEILHLRAIELASKNHLPLHVLSFDPAINKGCEGTIIGRIKRSEEKVCVYEFDA